MVGTVDIELQAKFPNMPLEPMFAYVGSASSIRLRNVPKRIGNWNITHVFVMAHYPDDVIKTAECVLVGGVWTGTIEGSSTSGKSEKGYTIYANGVDEHGNIVYDPYILGKGDIEILEADGSITPGTDVQYVHLLSAQQERPKDGDLYPTDDGYMIWQDGQAHSLGTPFEQITAYVDSAVSAKADLSVLDGYIHDGENTAVIHHLTCDGSFVANNAFIDGYAKTDELSSKADLSAIPTNTSQLSNDSGFITSAEIAPYHYPLTPTENTGLAKTAYTLALADYNSFKPIEDGTFSATLHTNRDLTNQFRATMTFGTYYPYVMSKYNGQTLSPELLLYFCKDQLRYGTTRPRQYYEGYMFRTAGAGFAIPCSEDGTPDGRLIETTGVESNYVLMENNTTSIHSIGFSARNYDQYGNIVQIDGQSDSIFAYRINKYKAYSFSAELANKSELPTKTSDLTNDSDFTTTTYVDNLVGDINTVLDTINGEVI